MSAPSVRRPTDDPLPLFSAELICSDEECEPTIEAIGLDLQHLEALLCDECGCCLQIVSVSLAAEARPVRVRAPVALAIAA